MFDKCEHKWKELSRDLYFGWDGDKKYKIYCECIKCKKKKTKRLYTGIYVGQF
jgi:hypothetical protein